MTYGFNVRDFNKKTYKAHFGIKFGNQDSFGRLTKCARVALKLCVYGLKAMRFGISYGLVLLQESPLRLLFLHG